MADLGNDEFSSAFLAKVPQQQKGPGQALLTGTKELIHEVRFHSHGAVNRELSADVRRLGRERGSGTRRLGSCSPKGQTPGPASNGSTPRRPLTEAVS